MRDKFINGYIKSENFISNALMVGVAIFVFIAAVMRWVGYPIVWSVEFAQLLFIWVIFIGANRCLREDKHISVDFFTKRLPFKLKEIIEIGMYLLMLLFLIFLSYYGILLSIENSMRLINNLAVSYSLITLSVPIGSLLMIITVIFKLKGKVNSLMETQAK
ncbi:hypothetical protein CIL05_16995 [Virgibacillus profundi]|uniref:Tripartite ATP-independent periplasmic transporters DctQ component domain-containing protein n=1 Tax=Virgibacillus profundi TaxID=2024555 RepID=A0A2A2I9T2_9BACI|nr:TRAP transporter small permease subunit [Virgibacillus profundi]PAV28332.1 hypothetical protein CIL05_16995 [Virgibacillus profundi]PXY52306.1 TRAP transporter small permease [Virgibacillus profundi]